MSIFTQSEKSLSTTRRGNISRKGRIRLRTLVALRWLAVIGQSIAIVYVAFGLKFNLPLAHCFATIAVSAWLNIILAFAFPSQKLLSNWEIALQLAYDLLQLSYLLYLTGGTLNPFSLLLIAPTTIAAATLSWRWAFPILSLAICIIFLLHFYHWPLPWGRSLPFSLPELYRNGIETAIIIGILFTASYSWRVAAEEARLGDALIATHEILAREQKLAALGGLAAAAAHELGTPLATIQLSSKEMLRDLPEGNFKEDAQLIYEQSLRCREILRNLSTAGDIANPTIDAIPMTRLVEEAVSRHANPNNRQIIYDNLNKNEEEIILVRMPEVLYGLGNFIENALSYSKSKVIFQYKWDSKNIELNIIDDGIGFDPDILPRLGEPYVTSRGQGTTGAQTREGMGLGFFIAKTLLERSGAMIYFGNQISPLRGAIVRIVWLRSDIEENP